MSDEERRRQVSRREFLRLSALITGTIAGGSLLQACSSSSTSSASPTAASGGTAPTTAAGGATQVATGPVLKIGVMLDYSKQYKSIGDDMTRAYELYFKQTPVVAGRKIELVKEDTEANADKAKDKAKKLVEQDEVAVLTGLIASPEATGLINYVTEKKVIMIVANAGANAVTRQLKKPLIFRTSFSNWQTSYPLGEWAFKNVGKRALVTAPDYAAGKEDVEAFKEGFTKAGGALVPPEIYPKLGNTDFAQYLAQIRDAKPDFVFAFYAGSDAINFVTQYDQFGLKKEIPLIGPGFLVEADVLPSQKTSALGIKNLMHYAPGLDNPENKKYVEDFKKEYNAEPTVYSVQAWDAAQLIRLSLEAVKGDSKDAEAWAKAMAGVSIKSPRGPLTIDPDTHNPIQDFYIREVIEQGGGYTNKVLPEFTVKQVKDPGK